MKTEAIIEATNKSKGATFASLVYTATSGRIKPETARFVLCLGVDQARLYRESLAILNDKLPTLEGVAKVACEELIASFNESLEKGIGNNSQNTRKGFYKALAPRGLRLVNRKDGGENLEFIGTVQSKTVLVEGEYKPVNSSEKTIAKNKLRALLPLAKIRTLSIRSDKLRALRAGGDTIHVETED